MHILIDNIFWMAFNSWLAILPVIFCWLFIKVRIRLLKIIFAMLWFLYLPNTLYLVTDLIHFPKAWVRLGGEDRILLVFQYIGLELVGLITFLLAMTPIDRLFFSSKWKNEKKLNYAILITLNMLLGLGIVFGRLERVNSWEVFTDPGKVLTAFFTSLSSFEHLGFAFAFGLFANFFYFLFRKPFTKLLKKN